MGIVNVTPDSFSDGGRYLAHAAAIAHGTEMWQQGAAAIDVGGESTRPGALRVPEHIELERVLPVVRGLAGAGVTVSIDTMRARVAAKAVDAGASMINDVSGGLADPAMATTVGQLGTPYVAMHWRGHSANMQHRAVYAAARHDVITELRERIEALLAAGVRGDQLIVDPGIGFAKTSGQSWEILAAVHELGTLGYPILIGASRKSLFKELDLDQPQPNRQRDLDAATAALTAILAPLVAWVRVHDVRANVVAAQVACRLEQDRPDV
ncbi:dihydropteroate synthase [Nocardioides sp. PD653-B2]|nr:MULTISPECIES: dihydropteroate synthase [unclassified Nocardioides]GAW47934.1 Putative Dihydropteroate synthase [Nocardioides sp. PD653-B2]GAW53763.1 putative Dihydropteroate synthase [Nocardioides sp. PD653]